MQKAFNRRAIPAFFVHFPVDPAQPPPLASRCETFRMVFHSEEDGDGT